MTDSRWVQVAVRWLHIFLLAYPREFRLTFGPGLIETLEDRCCEAWAKSGAVGLAGYAALSALVMIRDGMAERWYALRRASRFTDFVRDIGFAFKLMSRRRLAYASIAVTLALGIGATTGIFSVVYGVLLRPLPYTQPENLAVIGATSPRWTGLGSLSYPNFVDLRDRVPEFETVSAVRGFAADLQGGPSPERVAGAGVTSDFFRLLGVDPYLGTLVLALEATDRVVLSHRIWARRWGRNQGIVGRRVVFNDRPFTVAGVLPAEFTPPEGLALEGTDLWTALPIAVEGRDYRNRGAAYFRVVGRLRPEVSLAEAQLAIAGLARNLARAFPGANARDGLALGLAASPLLDETVGDSGDGLVILVGAVALLLAVACANVINLLLAMGSERRREMAIRRALGASRPRLIRQLISETLAIALAGGAMGIGVAYTAVWAFRRFGPADLPRMDSVAVDTRLLGFALVLSTLVGLVVGVGPALSLGRDATARRGGQMANTPRRGVLSLRNTLVAAEIAVALVLTTAAGLLMGSLVRLYEVDPGFDVDGVTTAMFFLGSRYHRSTEEGMALRRHIAARLEDREEIETASFTMTLPLGGISKGGMPFVVPGEADPQLVQSMAWVGPGYFRTMGIARVAGREFSPEDLTGPGSVVVVNESFARTFWPGDDAVGRRVRAVRDPGDGWSTVIGVVADIRRQTLRDADTPAIYYPDRASVIGPPLYVVVRSSVDAAVLAPILREAAWSFDNNIPFGGIEALSDRVSDTVAEPRFLAGLMTTFALAGLVLAGVGVYGTMSYVVNQRRREVGVRMALGAPRARVRRSMLARGIAVTGVGLLIGIGISAVVSRSLDAFLFQVEPTSLPHLLGPIAILGLISCAASYLPARRAAMVDPLQALRE